MSKIMISGIEFPTHKLVSGLLIVLTSKHGFNFSDGSSAEMPNDISFEYLNKLSVVRTFRVVQETPFRVTESTQKVSDEGLEILNELQASEEVDIVLVPLMFLSALKEMGIRDNYPKVVAFNSTPETSRTGNPQEKIVDINNWAW